MSKKNEAPEATTRTSFNWGFHDAQDEVIRKGRQPRSMEGRLNGAYALGYLYGVAHPETNSSDEAWEAARTLIEDTLNVSCVKATGKYEARIEQGSVIHWSGNYRTEDAAAYAGIATLSGLVAASLIRI